MESSDLLHRAILLARTGDKPSARKMLAEVVLEDPYNTTAWLWLVDTQETLAERVQKLEACLRDNPACQPAQKALVTMRRQLEIEQQASQSSIPAWLEESVSDEKGGSAAGTGGSSLPADGLANAKRVRTVSWLYVVFGGLFLVGVIILVISLIPRRAVGSLTTESINLERDPMQTDIPAAEATPFKRGDWFYTWTILPRAWYQISGRVLVNQEYASNIFDMRARLCPMDIGLGWKELGDPRVDQQITWWNQSDRTLHFSWEAAPPYSADYINAHISNNHIIPANGNLEAVLKTLKRNDRVLMEGLLVDARTRFLGMNYGVYTSMVREDEGQGACETFYVTRLVVNGKEYR
jgi:hypothetical protein